MTKLTKDFYTGKDVVAIAKELLGKVLFTRFSGKTTAGIITETEAYAGVSDKASHAYRGRRTIRNEVMYAEGGLAYVYLCYGIHHLFNVVTNAEDVPHAILIRAIKPVEGIETMLKRRKLSAPTKTLSSGPGSLSQALGIKTIHNGLALTGKQIWIEDKGLITEAKAITATARVGVDYAGDDALLPYRFRITL